VDLILADSLIKEANFFFAASPCSSFGEGSAPSLPSFALPLALALAFALGFG
jgi:hypothetical protein